MDLPKFLDETGFVENDTNAKSKKKQSNRNRCKEEERDNKKKNKKKKKGKEIKKREKKSKSIDDNLLRNQYYKVGEFIHFKEKRISNFTAYIKSLDIIHDEEGVCTNSDNQNLRTQATYAICLNGKWQEKYITCDYERIHSDFVPIAKRLFGNELFITHETSAVKAFLDTLSQNTEFTKKNIKIANIGCFKYAGKYYQNDGRVIRPQGDINIKLIPLENNDVQYGLKTIDADPRAAYRESIKGLAVGDHNVTFISWGYFLSGVLLPILDNAKARMRATLVYHGQSGSRKTSYALFLSNLTKMNSEEIDCNFNDSDTYMQIALATKANGMVLFDDNQPGISTKAMQEVSDKIERILRSVSDGNSRKRSNHSLTREKELRPVAVACITSELQPANSVSSIARMIPLEIKKNTFDLGKLSKRQANVDLTSTAIANFLTWTLEEFEQLSALVNEYFNRKRKEIRALDIHGKTKDSAIIMELSFSIYISFGLMKGYLSPGEVKKLTIKNEKAINQFLKNTKSLISGNDPVVMYLTAFIELVNSRRLIMKTKDKSKIDGKQHVVESKEHYYLLEGQCFSEVKRYWQNQSINYGLRSTDVYKLCLSHRIIEVNPSEEGKVYTKKVKIYSDSKQRVRVLVINKKAASKYMKIALKDKQFQFTYSCDFISELENLYQI